MDEHWIRIGWQLASQLLDALGCLLQPGKVRLRILVSELMIGNDGKPIPQAFRKCEIILIHCSKVSPGHARVQDVS
jgi:hypothetical protein